MKVLIVDGSKAERARLVSAFCDLTNVVVIGAVARLHTALHALGQSTPDVLITDVRLGEDEDAAPLVSAARRSATPPGIVVYASEISTSDRTRCMAAGADRFVAKHDGLVALQQAVLEVSKSRYARPHETAFAGRIAAGLAHDLNNQLTVVDAALGLAQKQLGAGKVPGELALARRALDTATMISQVLSRHANRTTLPTQRVDLAMFVRRTLDLFGRSIPMQVETDLVVEEVPPIAAAERDLEQIVMNHVLDACDAMPGGGHVRIRVHAPAGNKVQLVVAHDGSATPVVVDFDAI